MTDSQSKSFYVYAFLRSSDSARGKKGSPYYIGKGKGRRRFADYGRCCPLPKDKRNNIILRRDITEQEAFEWERFYIAHYGRVDIGTGILRNKSEGGEGCTGRAFTEEAKRKQSEHMKARLADPVKREQLLTAIRNSSQNEEKKRKIGEKARLYWSNPENRATQSAMTTEWLKKPETQRKLGAKRIKVLYQLIDPQGEVYCTHSMRDFCLQYDLCPTCLGLVVKGKRNAYKGWTASIIERYV